MQSRETTTEMAVKVKLTNYLFEIISSGQLFYEYQNISEIRGNLVSGMVITLENLEVSDSVSTNFTMVIKHSNGDKFSIYGYAESDDYFSIQEPNFRVKLNANSVTKLDE